MPFSFPARKEIWEVALFDDTTQLAMVLSQDAFNAGPAGTVVVLWIISVRMVQVFDVELAPPESGLAAKAYVQCDEIQTVEKSRLQRQVGIVNDAKMREIEDHLQLLFGLPRFKRR